jgi:hypothetical protein
MDSIKEIKLWARDIAGQWNGDEAGIEEERAYLASDIINKLKDLDDYIGQLRDIE